MTNETAFLLEALYTHCFADPRFRNTTNAQLDFTWLCRSIVLGQEPLLLKSTQTLYKVLKDKPALLQQVKPFIYHRDTSWCKTCSLPLKMVWISEKHDFEPHCACNTRDPATLWDEEQKAKGAAA